MHDEIGQRAMNMSPCLLRVEPEFFASELLYVASDRIADPEARVSQLEHERAKPPRVSFPARLN